MQKNKIFTDKKEVLVLTWRDLVNNDDFGGSEVYVDKVVNGLKDKYQITVFSSKDKNQPKDEIVDGIRYMRRGSRYTVYFHAALHYLLDLRKKTNFIIDVENGVPFFSPLYSKKPRVVLLHHVHNGQWFKEFLLPIAMFGYCVERFLMPKVYKNTKFITVSNSSKLDLEVIGIDSNNIGVAYNGVNLSSSGKEIGKRLTRNPTILYLGRLRNYKRIDLAIKAVSEIKMVVPNVELLIAGKGDDENRLKQLASDLGLNDNVKFLGFVNEDQKANLLSSSWVFVNPSSKEGWGVVNIEANYFGTPVVGFNVYGVRDSVRSGVSGLLAENYEDFVEKLKSLVSSKELVESFSDGCRNWVNSFNWKNTVDIFDGEISRHFGVYKEDKEFSMVEEQLSVDVIYAV